MSIFKTIIIVLLIIQFVILLIFVVKSLKQRAKFKSYGYMPEIKEVQKSFDVIIAARERKELICNCLQNLKHLGFRNVYICIDGCDTNTFYSVRKEFPEYTILYNQKGEGKISAQLKCLNKAKQDNILVIDADIVLIDKPVIEFLNYFVMSGVDFLCPYSLGCYDKRNWLSKIAECDRYMRQRIVRAGRDAYGVSNLSGYCLAANRDKYKSIIDTESIQDDVSATISLFQKGYNVKTFHKPVCKEIERQSLKSYVLQKTRWTAGNICLIPSYRKLFQEAPLVQSVAFSSSFLLWYWAQWIDFIAFITAFFYPPIFYILIMEGLVKFFGLKSVKESGENLYEIFYILFWPLLSTICLLMAPYYLIGKINDKLTRR